MFVSRDIFREIVPVCERNEATIHYVFHNPAQVMGRFVLTIFHGRLQEHLHQVGRADSRYTGSQRPPDRRRGSKSAAALRGTNVGARFGVRDQGVADNGHSAWGN